MADQQKLVLMVQKTRLQGLIWQTVLKSQQISVIWETPDIDLTDSITQLEQAGLALPDLLLLDVRLENFNPYAFCRWCRDTYPDVKVVLTNASQKEILPSERQWALHQGASDFLPGFQRENLVSSVAFSVKRVLDILDSHTLDNGALISVLLTMKRQLDARGATSSALQQTRKSAQSKADQLKTEAKGLEFNSRVVSRNGNDSDYSTGKEIAQSTHEAASSNPSHQPKDESAPVRRYRGLTY